MRRTYPRPERQPIVGERVRTEEGLVGVVVIVLPVRSVVLVRDNSGLEHEVPIESVSVIDGDRPMVYLG